MRILQTGLFVAFLSVAPPSFAARPASPQPVRPRAPLFQKSNPVFRPEDRKAFHTMWPLLTTKDRWGWRYTGQPPKAPPRPRRPESPPVVRVKPSGRTMWLAAQANEIREVAMRRAMALHPVNQTQGKVVFLEVDHKDPSPAFLKRFADSTLPVLPISRSVRTDGILYHDRLTDRPGTIYFVRNLRWISSERVTVEGGYLAGDRNGAGHEFTMERRDGHWAPDSKTPPSVGWRS